MQVHLKPENAYVDLGTSTWVWYSYQYPMHIICICTENFELAQNQTLRAAKIALYGTDAWDYGWLVARTDGHVSRLIYDPYTLQPSRSVCRHEMRWFCR